MFRFKFNRSTLTVLALGAVAATAVPMLPVWLQRDPPPAPPTAMLAAPGAVPDEIIVDLRDDAVDADIRDIESRFGLVLQPNSIEAASNKLLRASVPAGQDAAQLLQALRGDRRVEAAEPEMRYQLEPDLPSGDGHAAPPPEKKKPGFVPDDPRYGEQWNFKMVGAEQAWLRSRGQGIVVAVIDTGVAGRDSERGRRARDFGQTQLVPGYNFINDNDDAYDDLAHGTHVAGTIAESTNNHEGVAGLAFAASIMPLKVFGNDGWGTAADIADAIRFAADHGAQVINMSLGGPSPSDAMHQAIKYARRKGVLIVCSAGNGGGEPVGYPAAFKECLAVSAVGPSGKIAFYSSYGKQLALAAPGGDMRQGIDGGVLQNTIVPEERGGSGDDYYHFQGTSMAAPHVAAVAALVMAQGVRDPARARDVLLRSCTPQTPKLLYGAGVLNADEATTLAAQQRRDWLFKMLLCAGGSLLCLPWRRLSWGLRLGLAGMVWLGAFLPDLAALRLGADTAWNLVVFSALLPLFLCGEARRPASRRLVAALALGTAIALGDAWLGGGPSPFTLSTFGASALPWTVANTLAALWVAVLAAWRSHAGDG